MGIVSFGDSSFFSVLYFWIIKHFFSEFLSHHVTCVGLINEVGVYMEEASPVPGSHIVM